MSHTCFIAKGSGGLIDERWCSQYVADALVGLPAELGEGEIERHEFLLYRDERLDI
jgi:hypothetical protein